MNYLELTQADIDKADEIRDSEISSLSSHSCPLAQALRRIYPEANHVRAHGFNILARRYSETLFDIEPTEEMLNFMESWDSGVPVRPGKFYYSVN